MEDDISGITHLPPPLLPQSEVPHGISFSDFQRIAKGAGGKGPRQKSSKSVKKFFDTFRQLSRRAKKRQKSSKSVKKFFDTCRQFSRGHHYNYRTLLGGSETWHLSRVEQFCFESLPLRPKLLQQKLFTKIIFGGN